MPTAASPPAARAAVASTKDRSPSIQCRADTVPIEDQRHIGGAQAGRDVLSAGWRDPLRAIRARRRQRQATDLKQPQRQRMVPARAAQSSTVPHSPPAARAPLGQHQGQRPRPEVLRQPRRAFGPRRHQACAAATSATWTIRGFHEGRPLAS